jgi:hypothetical protein
MKVLLRARRVCQSSLLRKIATLKFATAVFGESLQYAVGAEDDEAAGVAANQLPRSLGRRLLVTRNPCRPLVRRRRAPPK